MSKTIYKKVGTRIRMRGARKVSGRVGTIVKRSAGRFSGRRAADKTIAVPLVLCERAFRGQVCAPRRRASPGQTRASLLAPWGSERNVLLLLLCYTFPSTFCLAFLVPFVFSAAHRARGMVPIRLSCCIDSCTRVYRPRRDSDTFARGEICSCRESYKGKRSRKIKAIKQNPASAR